MSAEISEDFVDSAVYQEVVQRAKSLEAEVVRELAEQGVHESKVEVDVSVSMHYDGSDSELDVPFSANLRDEFIAIHLRETSFSMQRPIRIANIRVRGVGKSFDVAPADFEPQLKAAKKAGALVSVKPLQRSKAFFEVEGKIQQFDTPVYVLNSLPHGTLVPGPAIIVDSTQTIVVEPAAQATCLPEHVVVDVETETKVILDEGENAKVDPILLAVFANRFMSIAEQMGHTLQRTSVSVSIKERLDFSCSIHATDGALVANAPHIPIHLGSMQNAVVAQHEYWKGKLRPGDVLMTNHPKWGGTHLPDITIITPVFDPEDDTNILFYVASRGHHQDIGGSGVTAMNPVSKEIWEEGIIVKTFKIVSGGKFEEEQVIKMFKAVGDMPGCSASRRIDHNLTDLQAKVSANVLGIKLVKALFAEFGSKTVLFYMRQIQTVARETTKTFLRETYDKNGGRPLHAVDYLDNGTKINLEVRINREEGTADFDWTGTGPQVYGNSNMPFSLTYAAIIYGLRAMINPSIPMPLNQGVLDPVNNITPSGTTVNPDEHLGIAGSTLSSQRLYDIVLQAFNACADAQGCASATGFGDGGKDPNTGEIIRGFAYGESIGGGTGAGPGWHGRHATHVVSYIEAIKQDPG